MPQRRFPSQLPAVVFFLALTRPINPTTTKPSQKPWFLGTHGDPWPPRLERGPHMLHWNMHLSYYLRVIGYNWGLSESMLLPEFFSNEWPEPESLNLSFSSTPTATFHHLLHPIAAQTLQEHVHDRANGAAGTLKLWSRRWTGHLQGGV